jgi:hypothetical protein
MPTRAGEIKFNINGKEEPFAFKPRPEQCSNLECHEKQISRSPSPGQKIDPKIKPKRRSLVQWSKNFEPSRR